MGKKTWQRAIEKIFFIIRSTVHGNYVGAIDRDVSLYYYVSTYNSPS